MWLLELASARRRVSPCLRRRIADRRRENGPGADNEFPRPRSNGDGMSRPTREKCRRDYKLQLP